MRNLKFQTGGIYHIYNRGVDKRNIYDDDCDRQRFMDSLITFNDTNGRVERSLGQAGTPIISSNPYVRLMCFCLMPNHFHLMMEQLIDGGISEFMMRLGNGYTKYFNTRNERVGGLFEGPFKAIWVQDDNYLLHLSRYIHLNPLDLIKPKWKENGIQDVSRTFTYLEQYRWSSYAAYSGVATIPFIDKSLLTQAFSTPKEYVDFMKEWATKDLKKIVHLALEKGQP